MDKRRLIGGLSSVAVGCGLLVAAFAPGGIFNKARITQFADTPFGSFPIGITETITFTVAIGLGIVVLGAIGIVIALAMKQPTR